MVGVAGCEFASVVGGAEKAGAAGVDAVIQATALGQAGDRVEAFFFAAGRIEVGDIGFGVGVVGVVGVVISGTDPNILTRLKYVKALRNLASATT